MDVAIADGDSVAADVLAYAATRRGHQPMTVARPERLLGNLPFTPAAVIVSLPTVDTTTGAALRELRARFPASTVVVVYEHGASDSRVALLAAGADEVLRSPIAPHELILHVESWERARSTPGPQTTGIQIADIEVDLHKFAVTKNHRNVVLTRLEMRLLHCLCRHYPNVAPAERLLTFGWEGRDEPDTPLIKTHISHMRRKLAEAGGVPIEIRSCPGVGYVLSCEADPLPAS